MASDRPTSDGSLAAALARELRARSEDGRRAHDDQELDWARSARLAVQRLTADATTDDDRRAARALLQRIGGGHGLSLPPDDPPPSEQPG